MGRKNQAQDQILDVADENVGQNGMSDDGHVVALVCSGTAGRQNYKTLVVTLGSSKPVLLWGEGDPSSDPSSVSPVGKWILSVPPSNPSKLVLYPTEAGESSTTDIGPVRMAFGASTLTGDGLTVAFWVLRENL